VVADGMDFDRIHVVCDRILQGERAVGVSQRRQYLLGKKAETFPRERLRDRS
jgi:hypothetical protein